MIHVAITAKNEQHFKETSRKIELLHCASLGKVERNH